MNLGQLFVTLGIKVDKGAEEKQGKFLDGIKKLRQKGLEHLEKFSEFSGLKRLKGEFEDAAMSATGFTGMLARLVTAANVARLAIVGIGAAMVKLVMNAAEASEHLFKFSINTGMDTTALQKWQVQAASAGVQADEVANSFKEMQRKAMEIQLGQGDAGAFQWAGVDWTADAETMMNQVEAMLKSRPAAMGTKLASDMGLSEEMISFLRMRSSMKPASENLILSPEEIAELKDFSIEFSGAWNTFKMALTKLGAMISPIVTPFIKLFGRVLEMASSFIGWLNSLGKWKGILLGIAASIAAAVTAFFFPITGTVLAITALLLGIVLIAEDIYTFFQGGDSFTGDLVEAFKTNFQGIIDWFKENWRVVLQWLGDEIMNIVNALGNALQWLGQMIMNFLDPVLNLMNLPTFKDLTGWLDKVAGAAGTMFGNMVNGTPASAPVMAGAGGAGSVQQQISIQIDGSKDPKVVGDEVARKLNKSTTDAVFQMPRQEM